MVMAGTQYSPGQMNLNEQVIRENQLIALIYSYWSAIKIA